MEIIVPAAGLSSRFPNMKPKYLLYDYHHKLMLQRALEPYLGYPITIGILRDHDIQFNAAEFIRYEFGDSVNIVILNEPTQGPADTVYQIIKRSGISLTDDILVKDCDSFFKHEVKSGNYVCVSKIANHEVLKKLASKSFVRSNEQGIITDIIEKQVTSDTFCVGGYKFESANLYIKMFEEITHKKEVFVSDVIQRCLLYGLIFTENLVNDYTDVGTSEDWFEYNDKPVIFCDIDGTLVVSQSRVGKNNYFSEPTILQRNVNALLEKQKNGAQFVFTTARGEVFEERTRKLLDLLGFKNYKLVIGLQNAKRILINDFDQANPFPRAEAININRNSDNLEDYL